MHTQFLPAVRISIFRDGKKPSMKHSKIFSLGIPYLAGFKKPQHYVVYTIKDF